MLLIFDCDGVLVDSEHLACLVDAEYLSELGVSLSAADIADRFVGGSMKDMVAALTLEFGQRIPAEFADEIQRRVLARSATDLTAIAGVRGAIESLPHRRCVASSSLPKRIQTSLEIAGLIDLFGGKLFSSSMVAQGKPAPDIFLHAAREMNFEPVDCVVIEDSILGVTGAVAAGMRVVGFSGGTHVSEKAKHASKLTTAGAHIVIDHMRDLRAAIETVSAAAVQS